jgi:hypothetical protein
MRKAILFSTLFAIAGLALACSNGPSTNNSGSAATNGNASNGNTDNVLAVKTPTPAAVTNNAPTLTPVVKAYCEALNKGDDAGIRKTLSSDAIASFEKDMKAEKMTSLTKYLNEYDKVGNTCELTNEQINGDSATAIFKTDSYKMGAPFIFVKENGEWKITNKSTDVSNMKPNSNAAK